MTPWTAARLASLSLISPRVYSNSCPLSQCWGLDGDKWKASEPLLDSLSIARGLGFFLPNSPSFSLQQHGPKHLPLHNLAFFPFILHGHFDSQRSELMLPCCMALSIPPQQMGQAATGGTCRQLLLSLPQPPSSSTASLPPSPTLISHGSRRGSN